MRKTLILTLSLALILSFAVLGTAGEFTFDIDELPDINSNLTYGDGGEFDGEVEANLSVTRGSGESQFGVNFTGTGDLSGKVAVSGDSLTMEPDITTSGSEENLTALAWNDSLTDYQYTNDVRQVMIVSAQGADEAELTNMELTTKNGNVGEIFLKATDDYIVKGRDTTGGNVNLLVGSWSQYGEQDINSENAHLLSLMSLTVEPEEGLAEGKMGIKNYGNFSGFFRSQIDRFGSETLMSAHGGQGELKGELVSGSSASLSTSLLSKEVSPELSVISEVSWESSGFFANVPTIKDNY